MISLLQQKSNAGNSSYSLKVFIKVVHRLTYLLTFSTEHDSSFDANPFDIYVNPKIRQIQHARDISHKVIGWKLLIVHHSTLTITTYE